MKNKNFSKKRRFLKSKFRVSETDTIFKNKKSNFINKFLFLRKKIYLSNTSFSVKKTSWITILFSLIVFTLAVIAFHKMKFTFIDHATKYLNRTLGQVFSFKNNDPDLDHSVLYTSFSMIISTIKVSIFGTLIGLVLAIPTSFLSARNLTKKWYINKPIRMIMALMRTIPPIVLALILSLGFNGWTAATIVLIVSTWSGMNKILYEEIESINMKAYYSMISMGYTKFQAFRETILKIIMNKFVEMGLYHFEIAIRISAILGVVGGIAGIGGLINQYTMDSKGWEYLAIPIFMILGAIMIIEFLSSLIRVFILNKKTNPFSESELSSFTDKKTYKINVINRKTDKLINRTKYKFMKKAYSFKRNFFLYFLNKMSYKKVDRKKLHSLAEDQLEKIRTKYNKKKSIYLKLIKKKPKKEKIYQYVIDQFDNNEKKEIARVVSLEQSKEKVFFVNDSKIPNIFSIFIFISILCLFIWSAASIKFGVLDNGVMDTWLRHIFDVDWNLIKSSSSVTGVLPLLSEALLLALVATIFGGLFAFIFGALSSRNITGYASYGFQGLILLLRSFPPFLVAVILAPMFKGNISIVGAIALGMYSIGMLGKLIKSQFDQIDQGPKIAMIASGSSKIVAFRMGVLPQVMPNIISVIIYRWELNLKQTITVGIVGASQFGKRYYYTFSHNLYSSAFTYLWSIIVLVIILEFFSNIIRKYIVDGSIPIWLSKIINLLNAKTFLRKQLFLLERGFLINDLNKTSTIAYYKQETTFMNVDNIEFDWVELNKAYNINKKYSYLTIKKTIKDEDNIKEQLKLKNQLKNKLSLINMQNKKEVFSESRKKYTLEKSMLNKIINKKINILKQNKRNKIKEYKASMTIQSLLLKSINKLFLNRFISEDVKQEVEYLKYLKKRALIKFLNI